MATRVTDHSQVQPPDAANSLNPNSSTAAFITGGWSIAPLDGASETSIASTSKIPSEYHSARIDSMITSRSQFSTEREFQIQNSKVHWSHLTRDTGKATGETEESHWDTEEPSEDGTGMARVHWTKNTPEGRREYFEELKTHPEWGPFFSEVQEVVVGEKIAEGAQAEVYAAEVTFKDGRKFKDSEQYGIRSEQYCNSEFVVKVMKDGCALQDLQRQWPLGMLQAHSEGRRLIGPLKFLSGGTLLKNEELNYRFAFVMDRLWGDLRTLIDLRMLHNKNQRPPLDVDQVRWIIKDIARDLRALHEHKIIHKDIKASNVLIFRENIDDVVSYTGRFRALLVDWECSEGVAGTGFWRAPEILRQMKNNVSCSKLVFTEKSDVYSFGMMCYEMVTGCIPFEGRRASDYDIILDGYRPELPNDLDAVLTSLIRCCWDVDPFERLNVRSIVALRASTYRCTEIVRSEG